MKHVSETLTINKSHVLPKLTMAKFFSGNRIASTSHAHIDTNIQAPLSDLAFPQSINEAVTVGSVSLE